MKVFAYLLFILILHSSCMLKKEDVYENEESEREKAEIVTNQFYELLKDNKIDESMNLFSSSFFENSSKESFKKFLIEKDKKFGTLEKITIKDWKTKRTVGINNHNNEYLIIYIVNYKNNIVEETITLIEEEDKVKIFGYNIKELKTL